MTIGTLTTPNPYFLAPLAGYTDAPFRRIAHEWGSGCAVTEMVSAEGLARDGKNTLHLLRRYEGEDNLIIQIFAPELISRPCFSTRNTRSFCVLRGPLLAFARA